VRVIGNRVPPGSVVVNSRAAVWHGRSTQIRCSFADTVNDNEPGFIFSSTNRYIRGNELADDMDVG
jgi:hypothetical protein